MKVLHVNPFKEEASGILKEELKDEIDLVEISKDKKDELIQRAHEFDAVIGARMPREFLENAKDLDYFIIPFAGIPSEDKKLFKDFPEIEVINSHFNAEFVAEHALALLLASVKRLIPIHEKLKEGDWTPRYEHWWSQTLMDKNLLILGFGNIGKNIAERARCFGLNISAIKRTYDDNDLVDFLGTNEDLKDVLPEADFIIVTLPETEETRGYLDKSEFEMMKEDVHIVNVGRGPVIDEEALYNALENGKLGGVALDTWWIYPDKDSRKDTFPSNYDLDEFDNVIFSPHRSSHVEGREERRAKDLADILNRLEVGEEVNSVDIERGY